MGGSQSKNEAKEIINAGQDVSNCVQNCCSLTSAQAQIFNCPSSCKGRCKIKDNTASNQLYFAANCNLNAQAKSQLSQQVTQAMTQKAISVAAGFGLSASDAENVANATINASDDISNAIESTIAASAKQAQVVNGCVIENNDFQNIFNSAASSTAVVDLNNKATQTVEQSITQKAVSVNLGILTLLIGIAVVLAAVGFVVRSVKGKGGAAKTIGIILLIVSVLGGGYLGVAYFEKLWPWETKKQSGVLKISSKPTPLPKAEPGKEYRRNKNNPVEFYFDFQKTGSQTKATAPFTWSVVSGQSDLNDLGLKLVPSSDGLVATLQGKIVKNPKKDTVTFSIYVNDSSGSSSGTKGNCTGTQDYTITVKGSKADLESYFLEGTKSGCQWMQGTGTCSS